MIIHFLSPASRDYDQAITYYNSVSLQLGTEFILAMDKAIENIRTFPEAWAKMENGFRRYDLQRFHHGVIYRRTADEIFVVAIRHHSRKPWTESGF